MPGVEVVAHIVPWLFTWGEEPRGGKKVGYFTCCHSHVEVAPLWDFQQEETQCIFHGKHMGVFLFFFPFMS